MYIFGLKLAHCAMNVHILLAYNKLIVELYLDRLATIVPEFLKSCINAPVDIFTCQTMKRSFV